MNFSALFDRVKVQSNLEVQENRKAMSFSYTTPAFNNYQHNRRSDRQNTMNAVMPQATITMIVPYDHALVEKRSGSLSFAQVARVTELVNPQQLNIEAADLVFAHREELTLGGNVYTERQYRKVTQNLLQPAWSSTAGMPSEPYKGSQYRFTRAQRFLGIAETAVLLSGVSPNTTLAVTIGGSRSIMNSGFEPFHPGDIVSFRLPPIDPAERNALIQRAHQSGALFDPSRAMITREEPANMLELPSAALKAYKKLSTNDKVEMLRKMLSNSQVDAASAELNFAGKEMLLGSFVDTVILLRTLLDSGLVTLIPGAETLFDKSDEYYTSPPGGAPPVLSARPNKWKDAQTERLISILERNPALVLRAAEDRFQMIAGQIDPFFKADKYKYFRYRGVMGADAFYQMVRGLVETRVGVSMGVSGPFSRLDIRM
jgi:hypothetical protein